jgi:hypothetical protein
LLELCTFSSADSVQSSLGLGSTVSAQACKLQEGMVTRLLRNGFPREANMTVQFEATAPVTGHQLITD